MPRSDAEAGDPICGGITIMATFPRAEAEIQALAHEIISGLQAHKDLYPNPP